MEKQEKYEYEIINTKILHTIDLGRIIKKRRKELGYTQVELAMMCNCSPRYIGDLENGTAGGTLKKLLKTCKLIGIDLYARPRGENHVA